MTRGNYKVQDVETSKDAERDTSYRTCILSLFIFLIICIIIFVIAWTTWKPLSGMTEVYLHQDRAEGGHYATISRINDIVTESNPWKTTKRLHVEVGTTRQSLQTTERANLSKLLPSSTNNKTKQSNVKFITKFYTRSTISSNISKTNSFTLSQTTPLSTFDNDSITEGHHETTSRVSPNDTIVFIIDNSSVVVTPSLNTFTPPSNISKTNPFTVSQTTPPSTFDNDSITEAHHETTSRVSPNDTIVFNIDNSSVVVTPSLNTFTPPSNISKTNPFTVSQTTPPSTFDNDSITEAHRETTAHVSSNDTIVFIIDNSSVVVTPSLNIFTSPSTETNWNISDHSIDQFNVTKFLLPNSTMTKILTSETIIRTSQVARNIPTTPATATNNTSEDTNFYDTPTDVTDRYHDDSQSGKSSNVQPVSDASSTLDASYTHFSDNRKQHDIIAMNEELSTESTKFNIFTLNVTDHPFLNTTQHKINVETNIPASSPKDVTSSIFVLSEQQTYITNITKKIVRVIPTENITKFRKATTIYEEEKEGETITPSSQSMDVPNTTDNENITRSSEPIDVISTTEEIVILFTESIDNTNDTEEETVTPSSESIDVSNTTEEITILSTESIDTTNNTEEEIARLSSEPVGVINTTEETVILSTNSIAGTNNNEEQTITHSSELIDVTVTTEEELSSESMKVTVVTPIGARSSTISKSAETHNSNTGSGNQITTTPAVFSVNTSISRNSTI
ncbi:uncharacterized protein [Periplaneta americana]|uniref:uncharacterized protein n=1 Tax=Periplaneta americana TaxID=6978 RepID=UPI0037E80938